MIRELIPRGWLTRRLVAGLRRDLWAALASGSRIVIIVGDELRLRHVTGLAAFVALLDDARVAFPGAAIWLCHIAPDIRAAARLAGVDSDWRLAPDRAAALDEIAARQSAAERRHSTSEEALHVS